MLDNLKLKEKYEATKKFVMDHPTAVGCVVTGIVSAALMHKYDLDVSQKLFYELGEGHALTKIQNILMADFIMEKDLEEELRVYLLEVGETLKDVE